MRPPTNPRGPQQASQTEQFEKDLATARALLEELMGKVAEAERGLAGVQSGKGTSDDKSLAEKLADARGAVNTAAAEEKAAQLKAAHLEKELTGQRKARRGGQRESGVFSPVSPPGC